MLRHKAIIQCGRVAFGFAGIHDQDEARHIVERDMGAAEEVKPVAQPQSRSAAQRAQATPTATKEENRQQPAQTALEMADGDGVIPPPAAQRQADPVQQTTSRRSAPAAQQAAASREPGADDEPSPPAEPVSDSVLRVLKTKMEQAALGEADLLKHFKFGYSGVTKANYSAVVAWIENPMGA